MMPPLDPDLTPEWLRDIDAKTALDNIVHDMQALAARLTMLTQRVGELHIFIGEGKDGATLTLNESADPTARGCLSESDTVAQKLSQETQRYDP